MTSSLVALTVKSRVWITLCACLPRHGPTVKSQLWITLCAFHVRKRWHLVRTQAILTIEVQEPVTVYLPGLPIQDDHHKHIPVL
jgi:hypothetical protein